MDLAIRAKGGDSDAAMTLILRHASAEEADSPIDTIGRCRLRLHLPQRRMAAKVPRSLASVDSELLRTWQDLAAGRIAWPLYLWGPTGTGKTRAALCFCDIVEFATYTTVERMCTQIMKREWSGPAARMNANGEQDLAVLDEVGCREKVTDLHYNAVKEFCDDREFRANRVAIYISNVDPQRLPDLYDDKLASRLLCGTWHKLDGHDRRLQL
jgi:hypothetical protein